MRRPQVKLSGTAILALAGISVLVIGGVYVYRKRGKIIATVDPTSDKNAAYQAANKVVEAITGAAPGTTSVGSWFYDLKSRYFPSDADRQVAEMLRATTPVVDRTILDARDAWAKSGLQGVKIAPPKQWTRSEYIALGGLALGLVSHVLNRRRHGGR